MNGGNYTGVDADADEKENVRQVVLDEETSEIERIRLGQEAIRTTSI